MSAVPLTEVFAALSDPTRLDMVARLASGDSTVNYTLSLHDALPIDRKSVV